MVKIYQILNKLQKKVISYKPKVKNPIVQRQESFKKGLRMIYPVNIPKTKQKKTTGRPKGSLDQRYAAYGGVFQYRKALSEQRRIFREQLKQQEEMLKQQRRIRMQQVRTPQQYQQQQKLPPELQGQGITPEYSQFPQEMQEYPQQMPQYPQKYKQISQVAQKRPIATVFKSSGGSPYPPVDNRPLASTRETLPQGYVESVDSFTGRRFLKKLPPTEWWMR